MIRKVYGTLNSGDRIVLCNFVLEADRVGPPETAMSALQLHLATGSGQLDNCADRAACLRYAGFVQSKEINLPSSAAATLTVAQEPVRRN